MSLACKDWELRPNNPCIGVKRFAEQKRERFFSDGELRRIGETLAETEQIRSELPGALHAIRLLALTGMRLGEVLGLRWDDVDLANGAIRLPDAKAGARTVPLGAPAMAFLASLERAGDYVTAGTDAERRLRTPSEGMNVTIVALDSGYANFSQFAQHYRKFFGETPSTTLKRSR